MPTIMVLDDKQIYRDLFAVFFEKHGFATVVADNAVEALGRIREAHVDLILMDLDLQGMNGLQFLQKLRETKGIATLPAVILTDVHDRNTVIRAAALGVRDYVLRSCFSADRLLARIHQLLNAAAEINEVPAPPVVEKIAPLPCAAASSASVTALVSRKPLLRKSIPGAAAPSSPKPLVPAAKPPAPDASLWPKILSREQTLERLEKVAGGKTMAGVVAQVISVASSADADLSDIVRIIQSDPLLASRVLQVANSAATGSRSRVHNVEDAARAIGIRGIQNMAISIGIFGAFPPDELDGFNSMRCWQHSFAVADLMGAIVRQRNPEQEGLNHLVGLCHDLGEILLRQHFMAEHEQILQFAHEHDLAVNQVESVALGIRHPELISRLLHCMGLPANIIDFIREFYERQTREQAAGMSPGAQLLNFANLAAHGLLLCASPQESIRPISRTEWRALGSDKTPPAIDPSTKHDEIVMATNILARLPAREEQRFLKPAIARTSLRILYVRPEMFIDLDPLAFALHLTSDLQITTTVPNASQLHDIDGMVLVGLRPEVTPIIQADLAHICQAAGRPDLPILALVAQPVPATHDNHILLRRYPIKLIELEQWLAVVSAHHAQRSELVPV